MRALKFAFIFFALAALSQAQGVSDDGAPFGRIDEADIERLYQFAATKDFDLKAELAKVYSSDTKLDENALGRVFAFSRQFETLDANARAYGQMIYSSLLNIGEGISVDGYVKILERQPADVQQRIRDFLFYPYARHVSEAHWEETMEETRRIYPTLFPKGFRFGHDDPVFGK
jgi:hypothetical protein